MFIQSNLFSIRINNAKWLNVKKELLYEIIVWINYNLLVKQTTTTNRANKKSIQLTNDKN